MPVELIVGGQVFQFSSDSVKIGRAAENDLSLPEDSRLEQQHAVLKHASGRWIIESCASGPLCIGDGRPVRFAWLNSGDIIHLTEHGPDLQFVLSDAVPSVTTDRVRNASESKVRAAAAPTFSQTSSIPKRNRPAAVVAAENDTSLTLSALTKHGLRKTMTLILGSVIALAIGIAIFMRFHNSAQPGNHLTEQTQNSNPSAEVAENTIEPLKKPTDPQEFLVLVGIGDLNTDNRPHILGVGWLWNEQTAVIPRTLGDALSELVNVTKLKGSPRQPCVIQGIALEVAEITSPPDCPKISILRLKDAAELSTPARGVWRHVTAVDIERMRHHGKAFTYVSYGPLPRSSKITGSHGLSLHPYDPELVHMETEDARMLYEQRGHLLKDTDTTVRLERGGLIVDQDRKIVGMTALDSTVVWSDCLERSLVKP